MHNFAGKLISEIIKREIIAKINESANGHADKISQSLINGLLGYVEKTNCGEVLGSLLEHRFFYNEIRKFKLEF